MLNSNPTYSNQTELPMLEKLALAECFHEPLDCSGVDRTKGLTWYRKMKLIRVAEEVIGEKVKQGLIKCPCHLAIGQEAVAVAVCESLRSADRAFGAHRSHSHYLAAGASLEKLFFEVLGKREGCSRGMGGSMHLYAEDYGLKGTVPIVAGTVSLAVGAAMAAKMDGIRFPDKAASGLDVGVAYFGDGATEEGSVHESLNLAMVYNLPTVFVCENNLFSSHLTIAERQPSNSVARFAKANGLRTLTVDGNDVVATAAAARELIQHSRSGHGPVFLEAVTYRWRGHVGPSEDIDVGLKRKDDLNLWKQRDPIRRLAKGLIQAGVATESDFQSLDQEVEQTVLQAWHTAETTGSYPNQADLYDMVFESKLEGRTREVSL